MAGAPTVDAAAVQFASGDIEAALHIWTHRARLGDADAMFNLGQLYRTSRDTAQDEAKARAFYEMAAERGHNPARVMLARMFLQDGEAANAHALLEAAAGAGDPEACFLLGSMIVNGDGVPRNVDRGYVYLVMADLTGFPEAQTVIARLNSVVEHETQQRARMLALDLLSSIGRNSKASPIIGAASFGRTEMMSEALPAVAIPAPSASHLIQVQPSPEGLRSTGQATAARVAAASTTDSSYPGELARGHVLQLGAFPSRMAAMKGWDEILRSHAPLLAAYAPLYLPYRSMTRLRVIAGSGARALCLKLRSKKQPCFVPLPDPRSASP
ncbi:tetratricopeptide repeat protein [Sphingomonas fennica]|nr:tetratricopeptide repeat protein [Sphingomonas fennica]